MDIVDIQPQKALWFSRSKQAYMRVCDMKDRHLLGAVGQERLEARVSLIESEDKHPDDTWRDFASQMYVALVKEALRRFLSVPYEEDPVRQLELSVQQYTPSEEEKRIYKELYPEDKEYPNDNTSE